MFTFICQIYYKLRLFLAMGVIFFQFVTTGDNIWKLSPAGNIITRWDRTLPSRKNITPAPTEVSRFNQGQEEQLYNIVNCFISFIILLAFLHLLIFLWLFLLNIPEVDHFSLLEKTYNIHVTTKYRGKHACTGSKHKAFSIIKNILPLDEGVMVVITLERKIITLDFVSGDNFFPRVIIHHNTLIQGHYVYLLHCIK